MSSPTDDQLRDDRLVGPGVDASPATTRAATNRRRFLFGGGVLAAGAVLAACGDDDDEESSDTTAAGGQGGDTSQTTAGGGDASGDEAIAMFAASLEFLAVSTYQGALDAAGQGALGEVPEAVAEFVTTARDQHQAALDSWNEAIVAGGGAEVTEPPAELADTVNSQFASVTDVTGAAELALMLEQIAGATYLDVIPQIQGEAARALAGSIFPIAQQHAAVLLFVLGQYPVPDVFVQTDLSAAP